MFINKVQELCKNNQLFENIKKIILNILASPYKIVLFKYPLDKN